MKNNKDRIWHSSFVLALTVCSCACAAPKPAHTNLRYNHNYARSTLDVWLPPSTNTSCPMVVFFHVGGFVGGDKSQFSKNAFLSTFLSKYLKNGIACASVNYPFKKDANYLEIMIQSAESMRFIKTQAEVTSVNYSFPTTTIILTVYNPCSFCL